MRQEVARAVKKAKNDWLQEKAKEIKSRMQSGSSRRSVWNSLKDIQKGRAGRRALNSKSVGKTNGEIEKDQKRP